MGKTLDDARTMIGVSSPANWRAMQLAQHGSDLREVIVSDPVLARVEHSRWLFDCVCGAGVAVMPDWPEARCLGVKCGRVYTNVQIPADRDEIEKALLVRPELNRNWDGAKETVEDLRAENIVRLGVASIDEVKP